jgi:hypothetical protein
VNDNPVPPHAMPPPQGPTPTPAIPGLGTAGMPAGVARGAQRAGLITRARRWFKQHGRHLWWLHSAYALAIGIGVVFFAQKGFEQARWLSVTLPSAWLLVVIFFRVFRARTSDLDRAATGEKIRFYVTTYVLKNLYQGMLFFLLPFYWKSTTFDAPNVWFVCLLAVCAVVSTLDIIFDRYVMRWRVLASAFHGVTLFGCLNLLVPTLLPRTPSLAALLVAAAFTVLGFFSFHAPLRAFKTIRGWLLLVGMLGAAIGGAYAGRVGIPPVPMHLAHAAVGPSVLPDGRLAMEVQTLHASVIEQLLAVTDVVVPGGGGETLHHVWRQEGVEVARGEAETSRVPGPFGTVRLRSRITGNHLPPHLAGHWTVDVETADRQLVGRTPFTVID